MNLKVGKTERKRLSETVLNLGTYFLEGKETFLEVDYHGVRHHFFVKSEKTRRNV